MNKEEMVDILVTKAFFDHDLWIESYSEFEDIMKSWVLNKPSDWLKYIIEAVKHYPDWVVNNSDTDHFMVSTWNITIMEILSYWALRSEYEEDITPFLQEIAPLLSFDDSRIIILMALNRIAKPEILDILDEIINNIGEFTIDEQDTFYEILETIHNDHAISLEQKALSIIHEWPPRDSSQNS